MLRAIRPHLLPRWRGIAAIIATQIIGALLTLWLPMLNADIIDNGVVKGDLPYVWRVGSLMMGATLVQVVLSIIAAYFSSRLAMDTGAGLRQNLFRHVQHFSELEVRHFGAASLITRATNDIQQIQSVVRLTFSVMIVAPIMGLGGIVMAIKQDAKLSLLLVVAVPLLAVIVGVLMALLKPRFVRQQACLDQVNGTLREQVTGIRVIRAFVKQDFMSQRFDKANSSLRAVALSIGNLFALMFPLLQLVMGVSSVAVIWFGGHLLDSGSMQVGSMFAFLNYLMQILSSVMIAAMMFMIVPRAEVASRRINAVMDTRPSIHSPAAPAQLPPAPQALSLDNATLQFPGAEAPVLTDISLTFAPGSVTGVIGPTGSGKTTLVHLIARQIDPTGGRVCLGGLDVRTAEVSALRSRIAVVPQNAYLMSGTIASTVAATAVDDPLLERPDTRQRLVRALRIAQVDFLGDLDDPAQVEAALSHDVSSGGSNFSGGQRQRLTIARALFKRADVLVFDDSSSALDYSTDARLRQALHDNQGDQAMVFIAQRVASVRHADQIAVLEHGRIVGLGCHDELVDTCPTYREIVLSQIREDEGRQAS